MNMNALDRLQAACSNFSTKLGNLHIGACKYENEKPIEEKILILREINEMLVHQLRIVKLNDVQHKEDDNTSLYITEECQQILKAALDRELQQKYVNTALLGYTLTSLQTNEEPRMQTFKQKINEQLKYLETTSDELKKIDQEQMKVMEESMTLRQEILITQYEYQEQLRIRREQIKEQRNTPSNSAYSEQLNSIKKRIDKINFMSTIISRLLIFGRIDWEENKDLAQLIEKYRTRYTVE